MAGGVGCRIFRSRIGLGDGSPDPLRGDHTHSIQCRTTRQNDGRRHHGTTQNGTSGVLAYGNYSRRRAAWGHAANWCLGAGSSSQETTS
jgi:hypothetical protein